MLFWACKKVDLGFSFRASKHWSNACKLYQMKSTVWITEEKK